MGSVTDHVAGSAALPGAELVDLGIGDIALPRLKEALDVDVELASPLDHLPELRALVEALGRAPS